jgi:hypothetical protein
MSKPGAVEAQRRALREAQYAESQRRAKVAAREKRSAAKAPPVPAAAPVAVEEDDIVFEDDTAAAVSASEVSSGGERRGRGRPRKGPLISVTSIGLSAADVEWLNEEGERRGLGSRSETIRAILGEARVRGEDGR